MSAQRVRIVVFDGVTALDVAGPADVFAESARYGADYEVKLLSVDGSDVRASNGMRLSVDGSVFDDAPVDILLIAGGDVLAAWVDRRLVAGISLAAAKARMVASVCTGAFLLAAAGLLDGHRATTHWRHARALAKRHPAITVDMDSIFVLDGRVATSAGVSAGIDLTLALVEADHGSDVARSVARSLVLFMRRPGGQSQFSLSLDTPAPRSSAVHLAMSLVASDPTTAHNLDSLARATNVSPRHLNRLFRAELNMTAIHAVRRMRIDLAKAHLDGGRTVTEAAELSGFGTSENLRRSFSTIVGISPSEYRKRFRSTCSAEHHMKP